MKKTFNAKLIGLSLLFFVAAGLPAVLRAQQISRVTIRLEQVQMKTVMQEIEKQTKYLFAIHDDVDVKQLVSVHAENRLLQEVLDQMVRGTGVAYEISNSNIILSTRARSGAASALPAQKAHVVRGKVTDAAGQPVIGASVIIKGTTQGVSTGLSGEYALEAAADDVLVVSSIGYESQELPVGSRSTIDVSLAENATQLDEVVIVGYGVQKRVNVTGAVGVISGKDLNNRPVTNAAAALQGADPSLLLTMGSGTIEGKDYNISIRGSVSLNSGSPLVLVDGIEASLVQVNPNDIESVSVLKDASACSIYGAKASAGVVLINTKNGQAGKAQVSYNGRYGISWNTTSTDFMTTGYDYVLLSNEFTMNSSKGIPGWSYTDEEMEMLYERRFDRSEHPDRPWVVTDSKGKFRYLGNFDWYGYFFKRERPETEHNVSIKGGNDKTNYYVSGRYLYREGMFNHAAADTYNGYSFRTKVNTKVTPWLRYSNNISFENSKYAYGGFWEQDGSEGHASSGILWNVTQNVSPTFVPVNPDGTIMMYSNGIQFADSPLASGRGGVFTDGRNRNSRKNNYYVITNRLTFDITRNKDLKAVADYTYRRRDRLNQFRSYPTANVWNRNQTEIIEHTNGSIYDFYQEGRLYYNGHVFNGYFDYSHKWGRHSFAAVAGGNFEDYYSSSIVLRQKGMLSEKLGYIDMAQGDIEKATQSNTSYRTLGFFGRVNYDYKGRYLLEASARYDGSSRFAAAHRWGFFPSVSAGWRISEEKFWKPLRSWWDAAKLRLSYGSLGNQQVSNYYYIEKISTNTMGYTFNGTDKAYSASVSAPITDGLTWETVITYNVGLDLGFLRNRLTVTADAYIRDTKDMLTTALTLPDVYGASSPKTNSADLRTKGYEIQVSWRDTRMVGAKPFTYGLSASLGDYKSKITKYKNDELLLSDHYVGQTLGDIWGYRVAGLFKTDEEAAEYQSRINDKAVNKRVYDCLTDNYLRAGDVRFIDLNGDGIINEGGGTVTNPGDKTIIGNRRPRYTYSMRGELNWNGIDFAIFFQGIGKINWKPDATCAYFWNLYNFPTTSFVHTDFAGMTWTEDNRNAYFPRRRSYQANSGGALAVSTDRYLQDASYLRLKNITLGYTLPINKRIIQKMRLFVSGENLAYWSPLKKYCKTVDPEVAVNNASDDCIYPYSRTFSVGLDVTF